jgi:hypothetical protein
MACSPAGSPPGSKVTTIRTPFGVSVISTRPAGFSPVQKSGSESWEFFGASCAKAMGAMPARNSAADRRSIVSSIEVVSARN